MTLFDRGIRNSALGLASGLCAGGLVLLAGLSFRNGDAFELTSAPLLAAPFRFFAYINPFRQAPPSGPIFRQSSIFEFTEAESMLVCLYLAFVALVFACIFILRARKRSEPSGAWAFPAILVMLVAFQSLQLLYWISLRWGF